MAKKRDNGQRKGVHARIKRTEAYAERVRALFAVTVNEILALNKTMPTLGEGEMFSFDSESAKKQREVESLLRRLHSVTTMAIEKGIKLEWAQADAECDELVKSCFGKKVLSSPQFAAWTARNNAAMKAFIERSDNGLNLSQRVWKSVRQLRDEMEVAITVSIGEGESAASMSRKVRQYLNDPDLMFRRFRYKDPETGEWRRKWKKRVKDPKTGKVTWIDYDKRSYQDKWTGPGYYKSSAQNAMRVARTETNIAYRRADHARWEKMDFVLGQRINLSRSHPKRDICDTLAGDYPKDFVFDGWHPQCFCYVTPILLDEDTMSSLQDVMLADGDFKAALQQAAAHVRVTDYPNNFKEWVRDNKENIAQSCGRGTEPYFIRNNANAIDKILNPAAKELTPLEIAAKRHAARTPQEIKDIKEAWEAKQKRDATTKLIANNILKMRSEYPHDVDFSTLEELIAQNNLTKMREEARNVAQAIKTIRAEEKALSDIIPDVHEWHKSFNLGSLKAVKTSILGKLDEFKAKGWGDFDTKTNLGHLKHSLEWQANYMATKGQLKYSTWEVAQKSYLKLVDKAQDLLDWENIETDIELLKAFKTKSKEFENLLNNAIAAQTAGDKAKAQLWAYNAGLKKDQLEAAKAKAAAARAAKKANASTEAPVSFGDECFTESRRKAAKIFRDAMEAESSELFDEASRLYKAATDAFKEAADDYTEASGYLTKWLRGLDGYLESSLSYAQKAELHARELSRIIGQATLKRDMWLYRDERAAFLALKAGGLAPDTLQAQIEEYTRKITARYKAAGRMTAKRTKELEEKIAWFTDWRARQLVGKKGIDPSILSCGSHEQHRFSETGGDNRYGIPKVRLEIYCPKGTQALYAAPFNYYNRKVTSGRYWDGTSHTISIHEAEVFLQRDTEFRIVSARWDAKEDRWFVKVEVIGHRARDFEMQSTPRGYKAKFK